MTQKISPILIKKVGIIALTVLFLFCGAAQAGSIYIDTTGLSGTVGETVQVPFMVSTSGNTPLYGLDLQFISTPDADIAYNRSSIEEQGAPYAANDENGKFSGIGFSVSGTDKRLFTLDVTPITGNDVVLNFVVTWTSEGVTGNTVDKTYTSSGATLSVGGSSTPVTPPVNPDTPTQNPTNPPVNPETPSVNQPVNPDTPGETPQETPDVPTESPIETPDIPDDIVPNVPDIPLNPVEPSASPLPLVGILTGFAAAFIIGRQHH